MVITARETNWRWVSSSATFDELVRYHLERPENQRTSRLLAAERVGFITDLDIFKVEERLDEPIYRDFLIPRGYGWGVGTVIRSPSGDALIFHAERADSVGPADAGVVARLDALRPHLARAALVSARLDMQRAQAAAQSLEMLGLPGAVLRHGGRLMAANHLLSALIPTVLQDRAARVMIADARADGLFADALQQLGSTSDERSVRSIPIPARGGNPPLIVHVVPIRGTAHDIFTSATAIVVVTPVVPRDVPTAEVVQGLFDLTPAEARVAREIGRGKTVAEIAAMSGLNSGTLRTQVKAILGKTGLHRQADLLGLLRGVSAAMPPESDA